MIAYAYYEYRFGCLRIGYTDSAVVSVDLASERKSGTASELSDLAFAQISEYLDGRRCRFELPLEPDGTGFQKRVWRALCDIPYGETRSYKDIAAAIGAPKAYRAVGMANHHNPIAIIIPCHRVIGADGSLTGYAGGLDLKRALLELEAANRHKFERKEENE